jgi:hypothetical protein
MKPLFTVHAGEYLVGSHVEKHCKRWNVWVPSKDTGIDLLVTNPKNTKSVSLQIKFSKDFTQGYPPFLQTKLVATGWWSLQEKKVKASKADLWVFVLPSFIEKSISFIIIPPAELLRRFRAILRKPEKRLDCYLWVMRSGRCWETRGLKVADQEMIAFDRFKDANRDFTRFLNSNGWDEIERRLNE